MQTCVFLPTRPLLLPKETFVSQDGKVCPRQVIVSFFSLTYGVGSQGRLPGSHSLNDSGSGGPPSYVTCSIPGSVRYKCQYFTVYSFNRKHVYQCVKVVRTTQGNYPGRKLILHFQSVTRRFQSKANNKTVISSSKRKEKKKKVNFSPGSCTLPIVQISSLLPIKLKHEYRIFTLWKLYEYLSLCL